MKLRVLSQDNDGFSFEDGSSPCIRIYGATELCGTGERFDRLDFLGCNRVNEVKEVFTHQMENTYLPVPIVLSRTLCFVVNTRRVFTFVSFPDGHDAVIKLEGEFASDDEIAVYQGPMKKALSQILLYLGGVCLPPKWVFGQWASANRWKSADDLLEVLEKAEALGFDLSVVVLEAFSDESTFYRFSQDSPGRWEKKEEMMEILKKKDIHLLLWQCPVFKALEEGHRDSFHEKELAEVQKMGLEVKTLDDEAYRIPEGHWFAGSMIPDFTNEETIKWWFQRRKQLLDLGISGFKTDGGEFVLNDAVSFSDGSTGKEMRNAYGQSYVGAYLDNMGKDNITFSRSGYLGSQKTSIYWAGDQLSEFGELRSALIAGLNASMCGVFWWGFDLAGFAGPMPSEQLYIRSYELATFVPIMQWHSEPVGGQFSLLMASKDKINDRSPWNMASLYGDGLLSITRHYSRIRTKLRSYLEEEASYCQSAAEPLMRSMFYETEGDKAEIEDQFLLGRNLLVAPVVYENRQTRTVFIPSGAWWDVNLSMSLQGPCTVQRTYGIDRIGLFIKEDPANENLSFLKTAFPPEN